MLNISLRMLHADKQAPWQRPLVAALQRVLRETQLGVRFFGAIATQQVRCSTLRMLCCAVPLGSWPRCLPHPPLSATTPVHSPAQVPH